MLQYLLDEWFSYLKETVMRRKPAPPTKEGKTNERLDTNTFVASQNNYQVNYPEI